MTSENNTMEQENKIGNSKLVDAAGEMIETYKELVTIRLISQTSLGGAAAAVGLIIVVAGALILAFFGFGAAWWLGEKLENMKAGFFLVGGFYTLVLLSLLLTANRVFIPMIRNLIIRKIYEQN